MTERISFRMGMPKIFLYGYWERNFGDDLFLKVFLKNIVPYCKNVYVLCAKKNRKYYIEQGVKTICYDSIMYRIIRIITNKCNGADPYYCLVNNKSVFVMLGGSLFADNLPVLSERQKRKNLLYAVKRAKASFVIGSNFGPFKDAGYRQLYKSLFLKVNDICFRDKYSADLFNDELVHVRFAKDISFEYECQVNCENNEYVVFSIIDLSNRRELAEYKESYESTIKKLIKAHINNKDNVVLLSLCKKEGDYDACVRLKNDFIDEELVEILEYTSVEEIVNLISGCKKIYATRFHAVMIGLIYKKNIVPIIYDEKTENALKSYTDLYKSYKISELLDLFTDEMIDCNQVLSIINSDSQLEGIINWFDMYSSVMK